jgi:acyl-coenzyme A synthetase/AMP-(fatty) acid ligase
LLLRQSEFVNKLTTQCLNKSVQLLNTNFKSVGARRDEDGYLWITGRVDDMLNVSGHLLSTAEVEATLSSHPSVAEAAVVSQAHPIKGECLYCFVTPNEGVEFTKKLTDELKKKGKVFHSKKLVAVLQYVFILISKAQIIL